MMTFTCYQDTDRHTSGHLMACERLAYRYRIHKKYRMLYEEDINNSAGKSIKVKEFKDRTSESSRNIRSPEHTQTTTSSIGGNEAESLPNKVLASKLSDIDIDMKRRARTIKLPARVNLNYFENVNEKSVSALLDQLRDAQRFVRREIRDIEKQMKVTVDKDISRTNDINQLYAEISRLKAVVIQEACDFEDKFPLKATKDLDKSSHTDSQLNRIKCISLLSKCESNLAHFTEDLENEFEQSVDTLQQEIRQLNKTMNELSEQRKDIVKLKVTYDDEKLLSDDFAVKPGQRSSIDTKDLDFDDIKVDPTIRKIYLNEVKSDSRSNCVSRIETISKQVSYIGSRPSRHVNGQNPEVPVLDVPKDSEMSSKESEKYRELVQKLRKKWEKLDEQYHIHSKKKSKRVALSGSSAKSKEKDEYKARDSKFSKCRPSKFNLGISTLLSSNIPTGTLTTFEASLVDMGLHVGKNMDQICRNIKESHAYGTLEEKYSSLDNFFFRNILSLKSRIDDVCKQIKLTWTSLKQSLEKTRLQAINSLNLFSQRLTELKRKFKRPCSSRDREMPYDDISVFYKLRDHISIFLRRLKLVVKFRNVLMFDRDILLPKKRFSLMEWYDLPMAVVYGMERFDFDEDISRLRLSPRKQGEEECRFDLRVYGPMEYQLGRALNLNERALLEEEKIAMLRNKHYEKRRKLARRTLIDMSEMDENACISCMWCLKDCVFGCQNDRSSPESDQDTMNVQNTEQDVGALSRDIPTNSHDVDNLPSSRSRPSLPISMFPGIEIRRPRMTRESTVDDIDDQGGISRRRYSRSPSSFNDEEEAKNREATREHVRWRDEIPSDARHVDSSREVGSIRDVEPQSNSSKVHTHFKK